MLHHIIVKWINGVDKNDTVNRVREMYATATDIDGVNDVFVKQNITPRDNRYDLMIVLDIDDDKLVIWDESELHKRWKTDFGKLIEKKCIFDCDSD